MKKITLLLIIVLIFMLYYFSNNQPKEYTIINGKVTQYCGVNSPFVNVVVVLISSNNEKKMIYTDANGEFYFTDLHPKLNYKISLAYIDKYGNFEDFGFRYSYPQKEKLLFKILDCYIE